MTDERMSTEEFGNLSFDDMVSTFKEEFPDDAEHIDHLVDMVRIEGDPMSNPNLLKQIETVRTASSLMLGLMTSDHDRLESIAFIMTMVLKRLDGIEKRMEAVDGQKPNGEGFQTL